MSTPSSTNPPAPDDDPMEPIAQLHRALVDDLAATLDLDAGVAATVGPLKPPAAAISPLSPEIDPIAHLHRALVDDLAAALDLDAGSAEATQPRHYARLASDLHETLNLDAGVAAIVGTPEPPAAAIPSSSPEADVHVPAPGSWVRRLGDQLRRLKPPARLALRSDRVSAALGDILDIAQALDRARDLNVAVAGALARDPDRDLVRDLVRELNRALSGDLALDRTDLDRARYRDLDLTRPLDRALDRALELARILEDAHYFAGRLAEALDHAQALTHDVDRTLAFDSAQHLVRQLAETFATALDGAYELVKEAAASVARAVGDESGAPADIQTMPPREMRYLQRVLNEVMDDFVGADLRSVGLGGARLEGIHWSESTRWPAGWVEEIRAASEEIEPGILQITGWEGVRWRHELPT
jgi:hypothetical protein